MKVARKVENRDQKKLYHLDTFLAVYLRYHRIKKELLTSFSVQKILGSTRTFCSRTAGFKPAIILEKDAFWGFLAKFAYFREASD